LDDIKTFILPCVSFHFKNYIIQKRPLNLVDRNNKNIGKGCLTIPQRASVEPLYLRYRKGGLNLMPIYVLADFIRILLGQRMLQSAHLWKLSTGFMNYAAERRIRRPPEPRYLANYLCGSMEGGIANYSNDISNILTHIRFAMQQRRTKINVSWVIDDNITVCLNGFVLLVGTAEHALCNSIHEQYYCQKLLAKPKQGYQCHKTATPLPAEWQLHMFAKWRFIHRTQLDCVPLNGSQPFGNRIRKCHRYAYTTETLPHILCHCKLNFVSTTKRHNAIQGRRWGNFMFQPFPPLLESTMWYLALMGLFDQTSFQSTKPGRQLPLWTSPCNLRKDILLSRLQDKRSKRNVPPFAEH
jgi:hypothetical protein